MNRTPNRRSQNKGSIQKGLRGLDARIAAKAAAKARIAERIAQMRAK